jgi:hypothetical protein
MPIMFEGNIAGSLLVSCTQTNYFAPEQEQQPAIRSFRARVSEILRAQQPIGIAQAEHQVWQQIEEELLEMPLTKANQKEY